MQRARSSRSTARPRCRITSAAMSPSNSAYAGGQHSRDRARCRRRLRLQGQALSRGDDRRLGGAAPAAAGEMDREPQRKLRLRQSGARSPDTRPSSRSTAMAVFSPCGSRRSPISAPMSRPSALRSRARSTARCSPASIGRRRSPSKVTGVFTNTLPTDAYRGAGRPEACYVLERLADRAAPSSASTGPRSAGATSFPCGHAVQDADRPDLRLRRFSQSLRARAGDGRLRGLRATRARQPARRPAARHRHGLLCRVLRRRAVALCRRAWRAHRVFRGGSDPRAARRRHPGAARHPQSRPRPRDDASRKFSARGSAFRSTGSRSWKAIPISFLTGPARSARARSRSAARRLIALPTRSSPRRS